MSIGFCYGYISYRSRLFPYHQVSALYKGIAGSQKKYDAGRWVPSRIRKAPDPGSEASTDLTNLGALGYLAGHEPAPSETGVVVQVPGLAYHGFNYYTSGHAPEAILMDMNGVVLHTWRFDYSWPVPEEGVGGRSDYWRRAHLFDNGDLLAICDGFGLIKIDKASKLLWAYTKRCHHDLQVMDDGRIYILESETRSHSQIRRAKPIWDNYITILDGDGKLIKRVSILESFLNSKYADAVFDRVPNWQDILHTNTLEVLDGSQEARSPAFRAGNVLISVRQVDLIAVVDMEQAKVVWALTGMWKMQHQPTMLDNGNMLLFDNQGHNGFSKVIEFDPFLQKGIDANPYNEYDPFSQGLVWAYEGDATNGFFSRSCGSNQRLPNGNTLITESDAGRVFEVNQEKKTVWEFLNPRRAGENDELIAAIFEMVRLSPDFPLDWLE